MSAEEVIEVEMMLHQEVKALAAQVDAISKPVSQLENLTKLAPAIYLLVVAAVAFGGWIGTLEWRMQRSNEHLADRHAAERSHAEKIEALQLWRERSSAQAVTASDLAGIVAGMKESLSMLDKRQQRTEDALGGVSTQLDRIEARLSGGAAPR